MDTGADLLPPLMYVRIVGVNEKGMVIEGQQTMYLRESHKTRRDHFIQRWLCKVPGQPAVLNTEKLLRRSVTRLKLSLASGFDQGDDNVGV